MALFSDPTRALLPRIKITGYKERNQKTKIGDVTLPYDPESLELDVKNCVVNDNAIGDEGKDSHFSRAKPSELGITFLLDDTTFANPVAFAMPHNLIPGSVDKQIKTLQKICGQNTKDNYLPHVAIKSLGMPIVDSPSGVFHGLLTKFNVKNELVDVLGNRVKAKVTCRFKYVDLDNKAAGAAATIPTKVMTLPAGASIAGAAALLGGIAGAAALGAANGADSVRERKPGSSIKT